MGVGLRGTTGRLDDFGARTTSLSAPGAPGSLSATAGNASVQLSWTAPSFDGGSPITGLPRVPRHHSPAARASSRASGRGRASPTRPSPTARPTTTRCRPRTRWARARSRTRPRPPPRISRPPVEPLPVLDDFNRPNENPLSGGGSWGNGANGSAEKCLKVVSNQLASDKTTTCTAVRSRPVRLRRRDLRADRGPSRDEQPHPAQGTHPAAGHLGLRRIHAAHQPDVGGRRRGLPRADRQRCLRSAATQPTVSSRRETRSSSASRARSSRPGCCTRAVEPGGDGDRLDVRGLRAAVGVGLRGTTGRLDDFGARTTGLSTPGAPSSLAATAGNGSVQLSWTAPSFDGGSPITGLPRVPRHEPRRRELPAERRPRDELPRHDRHERDDLLLQGVRARTRSARGRSPTRPRRRPTTSHPRWSRCPSWTTSTERTRTRSSVAGAGATGRTAPARSA